MLDDLNVISQRDPQNALGVAAAQWEQAAYDAVVQQRLHDGRALHRVIVCGVGNAVLPAELVRVWLADRLVVPIEIIRGYDLPHYADAGTLVVCCSYSGTTEEAVSCLIKARERAAQIGVLAGGGTLIDIAKKDSMAFVELPAGYNPRWSVIAMLRGLVALLVEFGITDQAAQDEIATTCDWLKKQSATWTPRISTAKNEAKQIALLAAGKTPVFYGGAVTGSLAYKWKMNWNETAKNVAFWSQYPESSHNDLVGWTSHPVEKPFAVIDLVSKYEHPQILKLFKTSDKLLSGKRPKAHTVTLKGDTLLRQLLWGCVLADVASIYAAIVNGVNPTLVQLAAKLEKELQK